MKENHSAGIGAPPSQNDRQCVVAHVNYLFFHSTQTFIYFVLSRFRRVRPICLTRLPESREVRPTLPPELEEDFYLYGRQRLGGSPVKRLLWSAGITVRHLLARVSPRFSEPLLDFVHRSVVPRLRPEADAGRGGNL